jgi:hypothetical protein
VERIERTVEDEERLPEEATIAIVEIQRRGRGEPPQMGQKKGETEAYAQPDGGQGQKELMGNAAG